ncbi:MAG: glycosyltransferase family 4 protein [Desulfarculus sp.]|nr:glycosyltransferase family 4 protein [Desulfarculus sp.]
MMYGVLHTEWSNGWGGQEIRILDECLGMAQRGHRVELAGCPEGKLRARATAAGLTFLPLAMAGPWDLPALWRLKGLIRERGIQVVHTHSSVDSWLGGMAARLAGVACVRCRHLSVPVSKNPLNIVYRLPGAVITTGQGIRRHLVEDYGLAPGRVFSIPTGVDTVRFAPAPPGEGLMAELGLEPGQPVVAVVAVLRSWKRHDLFCQMARQVLDQRPSTRFLIVGDGPGRARVAGYLDDMGLRPAAIMTGHREDVQRILPLCAVCVLASDKAEGVSQAVLQELAMERAVVASAAGDSPEVVRHGQTGLLVPPGELAPLTAAVLRLLDDEDLRRRLGQNGRRLVLESYSRERMLEATEEVYAQVLANHGGDGA